MRIERRSPLFGRRFAKDLWRLTRIYWVSPDAKKGAALLALAVALELGTVYGNVLLADSQRQIFDTMQNQQMRAFFYAVGIFLGLVVGFLLVSAYRVYARQLLEIRWRRGLTSHFLTEWIDPSTYGQNELHPGQVDNPDQRIAEDVRIVVASALGLSLSLLAAVVTLVSFAGILWGLSTHVPVPFGSPDSRMPGMMVWVAIAYAVGSTMATHVVGRRLVPLGVERQRVEADFRYGLVRFRENVLPVALAHGEVAERRVASERFGQVVVNWKRLVAAQRNLALVTTGVGQASGVLPLVIAAPAYFAGHLSLGSLVQTRIAYEQVVGALAWFVYAYQEIAQWRASIERLTSLSTLIDATRADLASPKRIHRQLDDVRSVRLVELRLDLPDGTVLLEHANASIAPGDRLVVIGSAGSGKTLLFRALAGTWPFGTGRIQIPMDACLFFLPQRPYLALGTLRDVVTYPSASDSFSDGKIREVLRLLNLEHLEARLDRSEYWEQQLSSDEQQRLRFASLFLHEPDLIFIDDATASLDEEVERQFYELLDERFPHAAVVTLTHRSSMLRYHPKRWSLQERDGEPAVLQTGGSENA